MSTEKKQMLVDGLNNLHRGIEHAQDWLEEDSLDALDDELKQLSADLATVRGQLYLYRTTETE